MFIFVFQIIHPQIGLIFIFPNMAVQKNKKFLRLNNSGLSFIINSTSGGYISRVLKNRIPATAVVFCLPLILFKFILRIYHPIKTLNNRIGRFGKDNSNSKFFIPTIFSCQVNLFKCWRKLNLNSVRCVLLPVFPTK